MDVTRRSLVFSGAAALGAAGLSGRAWADGAALRGVRVEPAGHAVRVLVAADGAVNPRTMFLTGPDRFVIDMAGGHWQMPQGASGEGPGASLVRRYRYAQHSGMARLVLDLEAPASLVRQELGGRRSSGLAFDLAPNAPFVAAAPPRETLGRQGRRRTVVIDPGHGGRDPGAVGRTGVREKDVVLDAALKLRDALEHRGQYQVVLTRDADTYVDHDARVQVARRQNADLFISVHADSHTNQEAVGASVYTISDRGAARAQGYVNNGNWQIDLGDAPRQGVARDVLVDLFQRETTNRSAQFAELVIPRLGHVAPLLRNTHRNANFYVLLAPDVPAVLIETGFLSNLADERRLADPRQREAMAGAMAQAVDAYFASPQLYAANA